MRLLAALALLGTVLVSCNPGDSPTPTPSGPSATTGSTAPTSSAPSSSSPASAATPRVEKTDTPTPIRPPNS